MGEAFYGQPDVVVNGWHDLAVYGECIGIAMGLDLFEFGVKPFNGYRIARRGVRLWGSVF